MSVPSASSNSSSPVVDMPPHNFFLTEHANRAKVAAFAIGFTALIVAAGFGIGYGTHCFTIAGATAHTFSITTIAVCVLGLCVGMLLHNRIEKAKKAESDEAIRQCSIIMSMRPMGKEGLEAFEFANSVLPSHHNFNVVDSHMLLQPEDGECSFIGRLTNAYLNNYVPQLKKALLETKNDWDSPTVIDAADKCMKIAYAISCRTLEDLEKFTQKHGRTPAHALTATDSYQHKTFYFCSEVYHTVRTMRHCNKSSERQGYGLIVSYQIKWGGQAFPLEPEKYEASFFQEGTKQNTWRVLYNDYCDRIRMYVTAMDLYEANPRESGSRYKDEKGKYFVSSMRYMEC